MSVLEIILSIVSIVLSVGFVTTLATLQEIKKEAKAKVQHAVADAKTTELENVETAIKIWRETAEQLSLKYDTVLLELERLRKEVNRLNRINTRIVKHLDRMTPENMEAIVEQIKQELHDEKKEDNTDDNSVTVDVGL